MSRGLQTLCIGKETDVMWLTDQLKVKVEVRNEPAVRARRPRPMATRGRSLFIWELRCLSYFGITGDLPLSPLLTSFIRLVGGVKCELTCLVKHLARFVKRISGWQPLVVWLFKSDGDPVWAAGSCFLRCVTRSQLDNQHLLSLLRGSHVISKSCCCGENC